MFNIMFIYSIINIVVEMSSIFFLQAPNDCLTQSILDVFVIIQIFI